MQIPTLAVPIMTRTLKTSPPITAPWCSLPYCMMNEQTSLVTSGHSSGKVRKSDISSLKQCRGEQHHSQKLEVSSASTIQLKHHKQGQVVLIALKEKVHHLPSFANFTFCLTANFTRCMGVRVRKCKRSSAAVHPQQVLNLKGIKFE